MREGSWKLIGSGNQPRFLGNLDEEQPESVNHMNAKPKLVQQLFQTHVKWLEKTQAR